MHVRIHMHAHIYMHARVCVHVNLFNFFIQPNKILHFKFRLTTEVSKLIKVQNTFFL